MKLNSEVLNSRKKSVNTIFDNKSNLEKSDFEEPNNDVVWKKLNKVVSEVSSKVKEQSQKGQYKILVDLELDTTFIIDYEVFEYLKEIFKDRKACFSYDEKTNKHTVLIELDLPERLS